MIKSRRTKYRKRTGKKKTSWYNRKYTPMQMAQKALAGVWKLKGLVNSERHITDIAPAYSGTILSSTTSQTISLNQIAIGDTNSTRTGNTVLMKTIQIKGYLTWSTSSTTDRVTMLLVQDKQQITDSTPDWAHFYTGDINSFPANFSHQRFKVLKTIYYKQTNDNAQSEIPVNIFLRYQTHVHFNGALSSDIAKNGLYLIMISNKATNAPTASLNLRLTFHDN